MKRIISLLLALILTCILMPNCFAQETVSENVTGEHLVIASFYPIYIFAENILDGIDGITLKCLSAPSTGCLHDYQLLVGDMEMLSRADAFLICGAGMEGYMNKAIEQFPDLCIVDSSNEIVLLEETHEHHHEHEEHDDEAEEMNAHMWLDPLRACQMVENLALGLSDIFPEHATQIRTNADRYIDKLTVLDEEIKDGLSILKSRDIVTFHEAFPYFAERYGLNIVAVMALEPEEPLSPFAMMELADDIVEHGCPPLFTEPQYSSKAAEVLSRETGAKVYELDPIVTGDYLKDSYENGMRRNLQVLIDALGI